MLLLGSAGSQLQRRTAAWTTAVGKPTGCLTGGVLKHLEYPAGLLRRAVESTHKRVHLMRARWGEYCTRALVLAVFPHRPGV